MMRARKMALASAAAVLASLGALGSARAEGSAQTGYNQRLATSSYDIVLKVDAQAGETINVSGRMVSTAGGAYPWSAVTGVTMSAQITTPAGTIVTLPMSSGAGLLNVARVESLGKNSGGDYVLPVSGTNAPLKYAATQTGTYLIRFVKSSGGAAFDVLPYDVSITPDANTQARPLVAPSGRGRLHSQHWGFDAGSYAQSAATNAQYYVLTPGGSPGSNYIWNMDFQGLAGYLYDVLANDIGLESPYSRSSRSRWVTPTPVSTPNYEVFVNPPQATAPSVSPTVAFTGLGGNGITMAGAGGTFRFQSNLAGSYQIVLDTNKDGVFDATTSSHDTVLSGRTVAGVNEASWDGTDATGATVAAGSYNAQLNLNIGEFHFVAYDDENNYPGLAINQVDPTSLETSPALMFWDDRQVPTPDGTRRSGGGTPNPISVLPSGVLSSSTRHSWGNTWVSNSFGNEAYVDTWVVGEESSTSLAVTVRSPSDDADGDGVSNAVDEYPCDPNKASSLFLPSASTHGMLLFEDLWPSRGDFDFNDAVVSYNYEMIHDGSGKVTAIRLNMNALAAGAGDHSGLGLALPIPVSAVSGVYRRLGTGAADSPAAQSNNGNLVVNLVDDLKSFLEKPGDYINTVSNEAITPSKTITVLIELGSAVTLDTSAAPFDVFLYRTNDPSHEIHRPMYAGTSNMNTALFGTMNDGSTSSRHFVTTNGVPFVLDVPMSTQYPIETHAIDLLYPDIVAFGTSGGAQNGTYYQTNVQTAHAFSGDVFGGTPPTPVMPARVEVYDSSCHRTIE